MSDLPPIVLPHEIRDAFAEVGVLGIEFLDDDYCLPSYDWLKGPFPKSFHEFERRMLKIPGYNRKSNDCNHRMRDCLFWADVLHRNSRSDASLAFGECIYQIDQSEDWHAICVAVCRVNSIIIPVPFEPQAPGITKLKDSEWCSARIRF